MAQDGELDNFAALWGVALELRRELMRTGQRRSLQPGEALIVQGLPARMMYFVLEGELGVALKDPGGEHIATIGPGETVGELGILDESTASAHVVARAPTEVLGIDEEAFWQLTHSSHGFAINLLVKLAARIRANNAMVAEALEKRRLYERAAFFDGLTGIHNRRWLDNTLQRLVARSHFDGDTVTLALIDVDHFRIFNDGHGAEAGDAILTQAASLLVKNLRPTDLCARFDGDEFVLILPRTPARKGLEAVERIRAAISGTALAMPDGRPLPRVTVSGGVADLSAGETALDLLRRADLAMRAAKSEGRNRVVVDETPTAR